ncbi:hypothetical protein DRE_01574 [Drechslerella stenobrocha 248]|uniref:F-box domain-containing protein n=1 Tax=Drechslerella stenobrocha 248 TaxID=1043628 RepID=W7HUE2_9PEZI|nr:hypothetical protein DRE_01574 [Drechslerella stenobrocha 248]
MAPPPLLPLLPSLGVWLWPGGLIGRTDAISISLPRPPEAQAGPHRRARTVDGISISTAARPETLRAAASRRELSAAQRVLFIPELLELVLFHVPSLQVLTTVRQVHPFFKDLVHSSPILAWQTWTSKSSTPPRTTSPAIPPSLIPPLYISSTSPLPKLVPSPSTQSSTPSPDPALELCDLLHPILSKWWKTIARNTANYRFFQVDSCVYNRFFPPDLLRRINCTRPALHIDDLVLSFTSTYAFLSYGCTHNITLDDREGHEGRSRRGGDSRNDGGRNAPHLHAADSDDDLISTGHGSVSGSYDDNTVTIEKLLRMMWIPLSETLRRSRDEKFLRLSGLMCTRTMTVTVKARSRDGCEERPVAELHLECMEPYDVTIDRVF